MKITRDDLLIAAFKLFMSVNYEKASFAELGKMLGMSKAGIFKYYKKQTRVIHCRSGQIFVRHTKSTKQIHCNQRYVCRIYR